MAYEFVDEPQGRYEFVDEPPKKMGIRGEGYDKAMNYSPRDTIAGMARGAGSIGATLMRPLDLAESAIAKRMGADIPTPDRRAGMDEALSGMGADPSSSQFQSAKLGTEVLGTSGIGGVFAGLLAKVPGLAAALPSLLPAIQSGGMSAGGATGIYGAGTRVAGGAVSGALQAGAIDPKDAKTGYMIGGAFPAATQVAGKIGSAAGNMVRSGVSDDVAKLAVRAKQLGIDVPADRLTNSRPLNAIASGLNYVPFSGRAATEDLMGKQLNQAVSRTFGQDSSNITMALRKASDDLGAKFEATLSQTGVQFDKQFLDDLSNVYNKAEAELGSDLLKPITGQINSLIEKGGSGVIDGQAAYNIKRTLDRIGRQNTPTAYHALELKGVLMDALNRSLGPDEAAKFAATRTQYGNMLSLEKLAKNGAEGELSAARLGNMRNINNPQLQELADIAAQFVKPREGQHGAMQRAFAGLTGAGMAGAAAASVGIPAGVATGMGLAAAAGAGRGANSLLNSQTLKNAMLANAAPKGLLNQGDELLPLLYRSNPALVGGLIGQ